MGSDKRHPGSTKEDTAYDAKYPYNRAEVTESGHRIEFDDTPGKERIREFHKSGTYYEIAHDGKYVHMAVGNRIEYSKEGKTTTVDKNHDEKIGGSSRVNIQGGDHKEVKGNQTRAVDGDQKTMVGGDSVCAVKGDMVTGVKGATKMRLGGGIEIKGDQKIDSKIDAPAKFDFGETLEITAVKSIKISVGGSHITITPDHISIKASTIYIQATGVMHLRADDVKIGGGSVVEVVSSVNQATPPWVTGGDAPEQAPD